MNHQETQTRAEALALDAQWKKDPKVQEFFQTLKNHAMENGLGFDIDGMNHMFGFANEWMRNNGPLPDSGVHAN
jgi:hypothetical protein